MAPQVLGSLLPSVSGVQPHAKFGGRCSPPNGRIQANQKCQITVQPQLGNQLRQARSRFHSFRGRASSGNCVSLQLCTQGLRIQANRAFNLSQWHLRAGGAQIAQFFSKTRKDLRSASVRAALVDSIVGSKGSSAEPVRREEEGLEGAEEWEEEAEDGELEVEKEEEEEEEEEEQKDELSERRRAASSKPRRFPLLGNKEKKELRAYAHQLGKKLKIQQVGKWGVTPSMVTAIGDALEANELLKLKVLDNCPQEPLEVAWQLEDSTEAQMVGRVGRTLLLYRPSLTKLAQAQEAREREQRKQTSMRRKSATASSRGWKTRRS